MKYNSPLYQEYQNICNKYLQIFCEKHDFDYYDAKDSWVANDIGGIVMVGDFFISLETIIVDIEEDVPEEKFIQWYDWSMGEGCNARYSLWLKQSNPNYLKEQEVSFVELSAKIEAAKKHLNDCIEEQLDCPF